MKATLLITGDSKDFGHGHQVRMHNLALELKRRQLTTLHSVAQPGEVLRLPLEVGVVVLDRRDTDFNTIAGQTTAVSVAIDNRGAARAQADIVIDALPHMSMTAGEYEKALRHVILPRQLTAMPSEVAKARITLCRTKAEAEANADFKASSGVLSPADYLTQMQLSSRPALYFGQALFEALYAGKHVQLYPISDYHMQLAEDLVRRLNENNALLQALDGLGLTRVADLLQGVHRKNQGKP
ncbi:hypothetical protein [Turneriella parva]|uniref:Uncharacterized protein n=1 Tax=Turneriella parva (strain ATCC BAA-1111 / DSM 21527 / NCTC 11395 / H) TaxID=869212 RepID=I4B8L8_TURPD|nr:hypothetical protein [Turneriella parva]AFM13625.1 hypothetical protein Turpa_2986 [Turneriella parva DSM 21527]